MIILQFIILLTVVFGLVIFFLRKMFYADTESAIQRLGNVNEELLQKQQELQKRNEEIEKTIMAKQKEAEELGEKVKAEMSAEMLKKEDALLKTARAEAETIISKAQGAREEMEKEIESQVSKKTILFAAEIIKKGFSSKLSQVVHEELVKDFLIKAKEADLSSVGGGAAEVIVRTPIALKKDEIEKLNVLLSSKLGRTVKLSEILDNELIAGVVLQFGSLLLDGSLASLLKETAAHVQEGY